MRKYILDDKSSIYFNTLTLFKEVTTEENICDAIKRKQMKSHLVEMLNKAIIIIIIIIIITIIIITIIIIIIIIKKTFFLMIREKLYWETKLECYMYMVEEIDP